MSDGGHAAQAVAAEILGYYDEGAEINRLANGRGQLERVRTQEIVGRHLPQPPAVILDVGGGPGFYACWLASQGYEVHLVDPVPLHVEQARRAAERDDCPLTSCTIGEARHLDQPDAMAAAVLLLVRSTT